MNCLRLAVILLGLLLLAARSARAGDPANDFSPPLNTADISPVLNTTDTSLPLNVADISPTVIAAHAEPASNASDSSWFKFDMLDFSLNVPDDQRWTGELLCNGMTDVNGRGLSMYGVTGGGGVYFFRNMALLLDVTGYGFNLGHSNGAAVGVTLGLRHHLFTIDRTIIYAEVYGGEIEASNNIPRGGTHLNDELQTGLGVAQPIAAHAYLTASVRYFHISNARAEGADRNPSANAVEALIGVMWRF